MHSAAPALGSQRAHVVLRGDYQGHSVWEWSDLLLEKPVPPPGPCLAEPSGASPREGCLLGNKDPTRPTCHLCRTPERHRQPWQPGGCREDPPESRGERNNGSSPIMSRVREREGRIQLGNLICTLMLQRSIFEQR